MYLKIKYERKNIMLLSDFPTAQLLVNNVEHTKLYAGFWCLILEILLEI